MKVSKFLKLNVSFQKHDGNFEGVSSVLCFALRAFDVQKHYANQRVTIV